MFFNLAAAIRILYQRFRLGLEEEDFFPLESEEYKKFFKKKPAIN